MNQSEFIHGKNVRWAGIDLNDPRKSGGNVTLALTVVSKAEDVPPLGDSGPEWGQPETSEHDE